MSILGLYGSASAGLYGSRSAGLMKVAREVEGEWKSSGDSELLRAIGVPPKDSVSRGDEG